MYVSVKTFNLKVTSSDTQLAVMPVHNVHHQGEYRSDPGLCKDLMTAVLAGTCYRLAQKSVRLPPTSLHMSSVGGDVAICPP